MSSLERILKEFEADMSGEPMRIAAHSDMPFAIVCYAPEEEYSLRKNLRLLQYSFAEKNQKKVQFISLARIVWDCVKESEGTDYLFRTENLRGFDAAQQHIGNVVSAADYRTIEDRLIDAVRMLDRERDIVFLVRAGGFAPFIYRCSILLDRLHRRTMVPMVLFYPGTLEAGANLKFYDLQEYSNLGTPNYRVKVYGDSK